MAAPDMDTVTQTLLLNVGNLSVTMPSLVVSSSNCPICVKGDATGDGRVGIEDAIYILQVESRQR